MASRDFTKTKADRLCISVTRSCLRYAAWRAQRSKCCDKNSKVEENETYL